MVDHSDEHKEKYYKTIVELAKLQDTLCCNMEKRMEITIQPFATQIHLREYNKNKLLSSRSMLMEHVANYEYIIKTVKEWINEEY